jgi:hypothetical protein
MPSAGLRPVTLFVMPEPEHPAAKAGRFVRAAGLAIGAAAKELEKERQQRAAAPPAEPKVVAAAVPAEPKPVAQPAPVLVEPPPPHRTGGIVGRLVFWGLGAAGVALVLVALNVDQLVAAGGTRLVFRCVLAGVLLGEALVLITNWAEANQRLVQRLLTRVWGPRSAVNRRERTFARAARDALILLGILLLALGVFEILKATVGY